VHNYTSKSALDERIPKAMLKFLTHTGAGGNHLQMFARAVAQACPGKTGHTGMIEDSAGRLSEAKLNELDPAFAHHVRVGIDHIELSRAIRTEEPGAITIIQAAENTVGSVRRLEEQVPIIRRICTMLASPVCEGIGPVVEQLNGQCPHLERDLGGMAQFVIKLGGGGRACTSVGCQAWPNASFRPAGDYAGASGETSHAPIRRSASALSAQLLSPPCSARLIRSTIRMQSLSLHLTSKSGGLSQIPRMQKAEAFLSNMADAFGVPTDQAADSAAGSGPAGVSAAGSTAGPFSNLPYAEHQSILGRIEMRVGRWLLSKTVSGAAKFKLLAEIEAMA